jgi:predicted O-methyltransferase YrrM
MVDLDRINTFVNAFSEVEEGAIEELYREAVKSGVPVIRPSAKSFLKVMLEMKKPMSALEIGAAVGYSALYTISHMPGGSHLSTIERDELMIKRAKENISHFGMADRITLYEGDALEVLKTLPDRSYDYIFVDAAKGQYINFLPDVKRLALPGALIITDNIFQDGTIFESRYEVERTDRTIHERIREYLVALKNDNELDTSIIPVGDGMTVSIYNGAVSS